MNVQPVFRTLGIFVGCGCMVVAAARAEYPDRPINLVAAVPTGSATDIVARQLAEKLQSRIGSPVIVLNKPGGGTVIATEYVAKSQPNGYTLLLGNSAMSLNPFLYKRLPYDPKKDFSGVALVAESPYVVVVNNELGVKSMKEFIALAKQKPKTINFASAGPGSATHMACELLAQRAGIALTHVPYANTGIIAADLQSNVVQMMCSPPASIIPIMQRNRMTVLGVSNATGITEPFPAPSVKQATGVDYIADQWFGVLAPKNTPQAVLTKLASGIKAVLADPEFQRKLAEQGLGLHPLYLNDFDAFLAHELELWGPVVHSSGLKLN
jgi:tripartite-type tricarboxylate transporter receptor subunit TctC